MINAETITRGLKLVVKGTADEGNNALKEFEEYFANNPWPMCMNKDSALEALQFLLDEKLPDPEPSDVMVSLLTMETRKAAKLSDDQRELVKKLRTLIENSKTIECNHETLGIAPFIHGGGFSPTFAAPELICLKCGLNITLFSGIKPNKYGLKIPKKDLKSLNDWAESCLNDRSKQIHFSDDITKDPLGHYEKSVKWDGPIPVKIVNQKVLESNTGR